MLKKGRSFAAMAHHYGESTELDSTIEFYNSIAENSITLSLKSFSLIAVGSEILTTIIKSLRYRKL